MFIVFQTRMQNPWQTAASHSPWSQQDSGITLSTSMGMIGVLEITLIVPTRWARSVSRRPCV